MKLKQSAASDFVHPHFSPAVLSRIREPFDRPGWIFELKYDGFRGLLHSGPEGCRLVSRNGNTFKTFPGLCEGLARDLLNREAVLDGEIVCLDPEGSPRFYPLLFRRAEPYFAAFDLLWLDGEDLRPLPLLERKRRLRSLVPSHGERAFYVQHVETGVTLFNAACDRDLEGIVAKLASAPYGTEPPSWIKVKNRAYSQAIGRHDFFDERKRPAAAGTADKVLALARPARPTFFC